MLANGQIIQETADRILANINEGSEDDLAEVADIIIVACIHYGTAHDGDADVSSTFYASNTGMIHRQMGLLEEARRAIEKSVTDREDDDD